MPGPGNGPTPTSPDWASDEMMLIYARGDYWTLAPHWMQLAFGQDGVFAPGAPWVLTSASANFQSQGIAAQHVVALSGAAIKAAPQLLAVDSVSGNSVTLRRAGQALGFGQPPAPAAGMQGVTFEIRTWQPWIDNATYRLKKRVAVDEMIFYRSSDWIYAGVEDPYRAMRDAVAYGAMQDAYEQETRNESNAADFARKAKIARSRCDEAFDQLEIRWGPYGNDAQPTNPFGTKLSR